jgi:hypothetical protein
MEDGVLMETIKKGKKLCTISAVNYRNNDRKENFMNI